ncbi:trypsin-like serine peptidase [Nesterenkonia suensis]
MKFRRIMSLGGVLGLGAATLVTATPVAADSEQMAADAWGGADAVQGPVEVDVVPDEEQSEAEEYWTEERMAAAEPVEPQIVEEVDQATLEDIFAELESANPRTVQPHRSQQESPADSPHIGKVFFSTSEGDFVCSANIVASANQSTVSTAGHCLHDGAGGSFAENFVFAPAYDYGESQYGVWAAEELVASAQWANHGDFEHDYAFAVLETKNGTTVQQEVGAASAITFNQPRGQYYTAYGYPAARPFNGQELHSCQGTATDDPLGSSTQGIPCDMTGGSSGGPWFLGTDSGGAQNSVNSYGYSFLRDVMFGPYFGSEAESVYDYASTR